MADESGIKWTRRLRQNEIVNEIIQLNGSMMIAYRLHLSSAQKLSEEVVSRALSHWYR